MLADPALKYRNVSRNIGCALGEYFDLNFLGLHRLCSYKRDGGGARLGQTRADSGIGLVGGIHEKLGFFDELMRAFRGMCNMGPFTMGAK